MRTTTLMNILVGFLLVLAGCYSLNGHSAPPSREDIKSAIKNFEDFKKLAVRGEGEDGVYIIDDIAFANESELRKFWQKTAHDFYNKPYVYIVYDRSYEDSTDGDSSPNDSKVRRLEAQIGGTRSFVKIKQAETYTIRLKDKRRMLTGNSDAGVLPTDGDSSFNRMSINIVDGTLDVWNLEDRINLTYCVSDAFMDDKTRVLNWMNNAAAAWGSLGRVKFVYMPSEDGNATAANNNVKFNIRPASDWEENNNPYGTVARTFFPSNGRKAREFVIYKSFLRFDPGYLFKHELGHALGFRHEHIWFGNFTPEPIDGALPLTPKDRASIMYYYFLPGYTGNKDFSDGDRASVARVYPN